MRVHERMDWKMDPNFSGIHMNTVQAELPRCIRFATDKSLRDEIHRQTADKLSISLCSFMYDLYGNDVCGSIEETYSPSPSGSPSSQPTLSSSPSAVPSPQLSSSSSPSTKPSTQPSAPSSSSPSLCPSTQKPSVSPTITLLDPCSIIQKRKKCGKSVGCTWQKGQCQSCSGIIEKINCIEATGCAWSSTTSSKSSENDGQSCDSCSNFAQKRRCKTSMGCAWKRGQCNSCAVFNKQKGCDRASGCSWINGNCT